MFKNTVIAVLISALWHTTMCEFNAITFLSLAAVLFFAVCAVEDAIDRFKSSKAFQRRFKREVDKIKISPTADQAS